MDPQKLKDDIKSLLRSRCDELNLEYFDNEDTISNLLMENAQKKMLKKLKNYPK